MPRGAIAGPIHDGLEAVPIWRLARSSTVITFLGPVSHVPGIYNRRGMVASTACLEVRYWHDGREYCTTGIVMRHSPSITAIRTMPITKSTSTVHHMSCTIPHLSRSRGGMRSVYKYTLRTLDYIPNSLPLIAFFHRIIAREVRLSTLFTCVHDATD